MVAGFGFITVHGRRREMGLGGYPIVGLKDARAQAERCRVLAKAGTDPIKARINERSMQIRNLRSLNDVTQDAFESLKASLKGDGKNGRWLRAHGERSFSICQYLWLVVLKEDGGRSTFTKLIWTDQHLGGQRFLCPTCRRKSTKLTLFDRFGCATFNGGWEKRS